MTPEEREKVPPVLLQPEEIAEAVVMFVEDDSMAGRVMIWQEGSPGTSCPWRRRTERLGEAGLGDV